MVFLVVNAIVHPRTGNEGAEWEWSFLSLASTVDGVVGRWSHSGLTEIRTPDRPARNESLYRLSYLGPSLCFSSVDENLRSAEIRRYKHQERPYELYVVN